MRTLDHTPQTINTWRGQVAPEEMTQEMVLRVLEEEVLRDDEHGDGALSLAWSLPACSLVCLKSHTHTHTHIHIHTRTNIQRERVAAVGLV